MKVLLPLQFLIDKNTSRGGGVIFELALRYSNSPSICILEAGFLALESFHPPMYFVALLVLPELHNSANLLPAINRMVKQMCYYRVCAPLTGLDKYLLIGHIPSLFLPPLMLVHGYY
jgi:hypothetical protein